jgi:hypothetical protein
VPQEARKYLAFVEEYFAAEGLDSAALVGQFRVQARNADVETAFESTRLLRAAIDASDSLQDAVERLGERVQQDFETLQVIDVEGWTFASSEVDSCVLAWLVADTGDAKRS